MVGSIGHISAQEQGNCSFEGTKQPDQAVREVTEQLTGELKQVAGETKSGGYYRQLVERILGPMVDFDLIARRVMARYYAMASEAQRERFAERFKESLLKTYASGLSNYSDQEIVVMPYKDCQQREVNGTTITKAKVDMEIRTNAGEVYPVTYAMYRKGDSNWQLENIILNGVNLGLTFRNQFNESLTQHKGNIDKVIETWSTDLGGAAEKQVSGES